jgi:uncharacterized membrane protein YhaH (DUF805 family)
MNFIAKLFKGRVNRGTFFVGFILSLAPGYLMILLFGINNFLGFVGMAFYALYLVSLGIRRLHDTGQSGWWFLFAIPPLTQFVVIYLILIPGQQTANQYGEPQIKQSVLNALINRGSFQS